MKLSALFSLLLSLIFTSGCTTAIQQKQSVPKDSVQTLTVGVVEKEIREGMSAEEITSVLGEPNKISADEDNRVIWVYENIATDYIYSSVVQGTDNLTLGFGSELLADRKGTYLQNSEQAIRAQGKKTIIITFDNNSKASNFTYHPSRH